MEPPVFVSALRNEGTISRVLRQAGCRRSVLARGEERRRRGERSIDQGQPGRESADGDRNRRRPSAGCGKGGTPQSRGPRGGENPSSRAMRPSMAAKTPAAAPTRKRKPPRKRQAASSKGPTVAEMAHPPDDARRMAETVKADGGEVLGMYRDPLGGHAVVLAALPIDRLEPTPYQPERSDAHVKELANAMERVGRFLDPLIAVRKDGHYWTRNGNPRLGAMTLMGMKSITALVLPEEDVALQILALNTEKAHNLKERSLEVIRMYRGLVGARGRDPESDFAAIFEEPHFIT